MSIRTSTSSDSPDEIKPFDAKEESYIDPVQENTFSSPTCKENNELVINDNTANTEILGNNLSSIYTQRTSNTLCDLPGLSSTNSSGSPQRSSLDSSETQ